MTTTYDVSGMTCGHCVASITKEVAAVGGVQAVKVDLQTGQVTVTSDLPLDPVLVAAAVEEAGYALSGVSS